MAPFPGSLLKGWKCVCFIGAAAFLGLGIPDRSRADEAQRPREILPDSIREVAAVASAGATLDPAVPTVVRAVLSDSEATATMQFEVALKMRNLAELRARIASGEVIPPSDMADKYYPEASDYEAAIAWVEGLGLTVTNRYDNHLSFFVRGSVSQIRDALKMSFARVAYRGGEYTSAVTAPSVPPELVSSLVGINGLQPHLRMRSHHIRLKPADASTESPPYGPNNLAVAYHATGLGVNGAGETIGLLGYAFPSQADLTAFWANYSIPQTAGSVTEVPVGSGPPPNPAPGDAEEITLDTEWASSVAPGAAIRVYGTQDNDEVGNMALQQILSDLPNQPRMRQISVSYGQNENEYTPSQMATTSAYLASMASAGVTVFFSSGDGGSRPDPNTGGYNSQDTLRVDYPGSDPSATAVGGTSLAPTFFPSAPYTESVWNSNGGASGGGASTQFTRPNWQTGLGIPPGTQRLEPDVAASADPDYGADVIFQGAHDTVGGTSWSTPVWAGYCALFNQARLAANPNLGPVGMLNPRIYPLIGGDCFQDITSGRNGDYPAGPGYDECTGIGSPDVGLLVQALSVASPLKIPPTISLQPSGQTVNSGQSGSFSVAAASFTPTTYQWQYLAAGSNEWLSIEDGGSFSGATTSTLTVTPQTDTMSGAQVRCIVTNQGGSTNSDPAVLTVPEVAPATPTFAAGSLAYYTGGASGYSLQPNLFDLGNPKPPISYQWYHDGVVVPGATSSAYYLNNLDDVDTGDYLLTATNPGGTVVAGQAAVQMLAQEADTPWGYAQQQGSIVYFQESTRILRYDLRAGAWLPPVVVDSPIWALCAAPEGIYVSLGLTTRRYSLDLSEYTTVGTTTLETRAIFVSGSYFYLAGSSEVGVSWAIDSHRRADGSFVKSSVCIFGSDDFSSVAATNPAGTGLYPTAMVYLEGHGGFIGWTLDALGGVEGYPEEVAADSVRNGTRAFVFPDGEHVCDDTGMVCYGSSLSCSGSLGPSFNDLAFFPDGNAAVLRDNFVTLYAAGTLAELGRFQLPNTADRLFVHGTTLSAFSPPGIPGGSIGVAEATEAQITASPRQAAPVVNPASTTFIPDDGFVGSDGLLYLLSKLNRSIFAWSPSTRTYLKSIPLQGSPVWMSYSKALNQVYLAYDDYRVTEIQLGTSDAETFWVNLCNEPVTFAAADGQVFVEEEGSTPDAMASAWVYDESGGLEQQIESAPVQPAGNGLSFYWDSVTGGLYTLGSGGVAAQLWELPVGNGALDKLKAGPGNSGNEASGLYPVRFSTDGTLAVTETGSVFNTATLAQIGALGSPFVDAAWLDSTVTALSASGSNSVVQQAAAPAFAAGNSAAIFGTPLRIWPTPDNKLVVLTVLDGASNLTVLDAQATILSSSFGPAITAQPTGQTMNAGSTVEFTAEAAGSATYQWQFKGVNLTDGPGVSGADGPQLVLTNVGAASAGSYTCIVTGSAGSSITAPANLVVQSSAAPGSVGSISARAFVGANDGLLIGGFFVAGQTSRSVLVQALGPALIPSPYNVASPLQHPALSIHQSQNGRDVVLYSNTGWGSNPVLLATAAKLTALPVLQPGSADSEILATLPPGGYTAEVKGADGGTGVALVAIYELP